jgi:hypothetical protein
MIKRIDEMKRKISSLDEFRSSASAFREEEETALRISILHTTNITDIFAPEYARDIHANLAELLLDEYDEGKIKSYVPDKDDGLTSNQRRFLLKLKLVLINNDPDSEAAHCERYVDDMVTFLCERANLDDGLELTMRPCNLYLSVGEDKFAAIADKEGRRGTELTYLIQEDKHRKSSSYKHGDVQMACAMIAATQYNYNLLERVYPPKIVGVKFVADAVYFCSMTPDAEYINELFDGMPESAVAVMHRFGGLSLATPLERMAVFTHMTSLYHWALSL